MLVCMELMKDSTETLHFSGKADLGNSFKDWSFHPAIIAMAQGPNWDITAGCNFQYILKPASKHTIVF